MQEIGRSLDVLPFWVHWSHSPQDFYSVVLRVSQVSVPTQAAMALRIILGFAIRSTPKR